MFTAAQTRDVTAWDRKAAACKFCPIGARNAGAVVEPMAKSRSEMRLICPRCTRQSTRLIMGLHCISCYNRAREARLGINAKGTRPALSDTLHTVTVAVREGLVAAVRQSGTVAGRPEAILAMAKRATSTMAFSLAPLGFAS